MLYGILEAARQQFGLLACKPLLVDGILHLGGRDILLALQDVVLHHVVEAVLQSILQHVLSRALRSTVKAKVYLLLGL